MKAINKISGDPYQSFTLIGNDGQQIDLTLRYMPTQRIWAVDVSWDDFSVNGLQMTVSPNILRNYSNILTFGIGVISNDGIDPMFLNDFTSGRVQVFLLNRDDVEAVEASLFI